MLIKAEKYSVTLDADDLDEIFDIAFTSVGLCSRWCQAVEVIPSNGTIGEARVDVYGDVRRGVFDVAREIAGSDRPEEWGVADGLLIHVTKGDLEMAIEEMLNEGVWDVEDITSHGWGDVQAREFDRMVQIATLGAVLY